MKRIVNHLAILSIAGLASVFAQCLDSGEVRTARIDAARARVGIGFIQNRDRQFSPYNSDNFANMLEFELMRLQYSIVNVDLSSIKPPTEQSTDNTDREAARRANSETSRSEGDSVSTRVDSSANAANGSGNDVAVSNADALFPEHLRGIAGELTAAQVVDQPERRLLTLPEIQTISSHNQYDFFIQGAISRTEAGLLLDIEENALVFLEIFDQQGRRVGAINFTVNERSLGSARFLQDVAARIAAAFHQEISRKP
ncbi:MAG: lipoprotein [Leptospiraceae bacterium]|nr:lipoprotein [Leptospiraceae bacterium]